MAKSTVDQSLARPGKGGVLLDPKYRFKPGQSGNPAGRPNAGATVHEQINILCAQELTEDELRRVAKDRRNQWSRRVAAERMLRAMESGDLADFSAVLKGEKDLVELRAAGIETAVVKKLKVKNRVTADGETFVERELELYDRAGAAMNDIIAQTDGQPTKRIEVASNGGYNQHEFEEKLTALARRMIEWGRGPEPTAGDDSRAHGEATGIGRGKVIDIAWLAAAQGAQESREGVQEPGRRLRA